MIKKGYRFGIHDLIANRFSGVRKELNGIIEIAGIITCVADEKVLVVLNVTIQDLNSLYIFKGAILQNREIEYIALFQDEIEEIKRRVSDTDYQRIEHFLARD